MAEEQYMTPIKVRVKKDDPLSSFAASQLSSVVPTAASIVSPVQQIAESAGLKVAPEPVLQSKGVPGVDYPVQSKEQYMSTGIKGIDFPDVSFDPINLIQTPGNKLEIGMLNPIQIPGFTGFDLPPVEQKKELVPQLQSSVGAGSVDQPKPLELSNPIQSFGGAQSFDLQKPLEDSKSDMPNKSIFEKVDNAIDSSIATIKKYNPIGNTSDYIGEKVSDLGNIIESTASYIPEANNVLLNIGSQIGKTLITGLGSTVKSAGQLADALYDDTYIDKLQNANAKNFATIEATFKSDSEKVNKDYENQYKSFMVGNNIKDIQLLNSAQQKEYDNITESYQSNIDYINNKRIEELQKWSLTDEADTWARRAKDAMNVGFAVFGVKSLVAAGSVAGTLATTKKVLSGLTSVAMTQSTNPLFQIAQLFSSNGNDYDVVKNDNFLNKEGKPAGLNALDQVFLTDIAQSYDESDDKTKNEYINQINDINSRNGYIGDKVNRDNVYQYLGDNFTPSWQSLDNANTDITQVNSQGGYDYLFRKDKKNTFDNKTVSDLAKEGDIQDSKNPNYIFGEQYTPVNSILGYEQELYNATEETLNFFGTKDLRGQELQKFVSDKVAGVRQYASSAKQYAEQALALNPDMSEEDKKKIKSFIDSPLLVRKGLKEILYSTNSRMVKEGSGLQGDEFSEKYQQIFKDELGKNKTITQAFDPEGKGSAERTISDIVNKYGIAPGVFNTVGQSVQNFESSLGSYIYGSNNQFLATQSVAANVIKKSDIAFGLAVETALDKFGGTRFNPFKSLTKKLDATDIGKVVGEGLTETLQTTASTPFASDNPQATTSTNFIENLGVSFGFGSLGGANQILQKRLREKGIDANKMNTDISKMQAEGYSNEQIEATIKAKKDLLNNAYTRFKNENTPNGPQGPNNEVKNTFDSVFQNLSKQDSTRQGTNNAQVENPAGEISQTKDINTSSPITTTIPQQEKSVFINKKMEKEGFQPGRYNIIQENDTIYLQNDSSKDIKYNVSLDSLGNYQINNGTDNKIISPTDITIANQSTNISKTRQAGFDYINRIGSTEKQSIVLSPEKYAIESTKKNPNKNNRLLTIKDRAGGEEGTSAYGILLSSFKGKIKGDIELKYRGSYETDSDQVDESGIPAKITIPPSVEIYNNSELIGYVKVTNEDFEDSSAVLSENESTKKVKEFFNQKIKEWAGNDGSYFVIDDTDTPRIENGNRVKGYYDFKNKKIHLTKYADYTTILHEVGHAYMDMFVANGEGGETKFNEIVSWYNQSYPNKPYTKTYSQYQQESRDGAIGLDTSELHEAFARRFEQYTFTEAKKDLGDQYKNTILGSIFNEMKIFFSMVKKYIERLKYGNRITPEVKKIFQDIITGGTESQAMEKVVEMSQGQKGHDALKNSTHIIENIASILGKDNLFDIFLNRYFNDISVRAKLNHIDSIKSLPKEKIGQFAKLVLQSTGYEPIYIMEKIQEKLMGGIKGRTILAQHYDQFAVDENIVYNSRERLARFMLQNDMHPLMFNDLYSIIASIKSDLFIESEVKSALAEQDIIQGTAETVQFLSGRIPSKKGTKRYTRTETKYVDVEEHYKRLLGYNILEYDGKSADNIIADIKYYEIYLKLKDIKADPSIKSAILYAMDYRPYLQFMDSFPNNQKILLNNLLYRYFRTYKNSDNITQSFADFVEDNKSTSYYKDLYKELGIKEFSNRKSKIIKDFSDFLSQTDRIGTLHNLFLEDRNPYSEIADHMFHDVITKTKQKEGKYKGVPLVAGLNSWFKSISKGKSTPGSTWTSLPYQETYYKLESFIDNEVYGHIAREYRRIYDIVQSSFRDEIALYNDMKQSANQENVLGYLLSNFFVEPLEPNTGFVGSNNMLKYAYNYKAISHESYIDLDIVGDDGKVSKGGDNNFSIPLGEVPKTTYKNSNTVEISKYGDASSLDQPGLEAYSIPGIRITIDEGGTVYANIKVNGEGEFDIPREYRDKFNTAISIYMDYLRDNKSPYSFGHTKFGSLVDNIDKGKSLADKLDTEQDFISSATHYYKKTKNIIKQYLTLQQGYISSINIPNLIRRSAGIFGSKTGLVSFHDGSTESLIDTDLMYSPAYWKVASQMILKFGFIKNQLSDKDIYTIIDILSSPKGLEKKGSYERMFLDSITGNSELDLARNTVKFLKAIKLQTVLGIVDENSKVDLEIDYGNTMLNILNKFYQIEGNDISKYKNAYNQFYSILTAIGDKDTYTFVNWLINGYTPDRLKELLKGKAAGDKEQADLLTKYYAKYSEVINIVELLGSIGSSINTDVLDKISTQSQNIGQNLLFGKLMSSSSQKVIETAAEEINKESSSTGFTQRISSAEDGLGTFNINPSERGKKVLNIILESILFNNDFDKYRDRGVITGKNPIRVGYSFLFGHGVDAINGSLSLTNEAHNSAIVKDVDNFINQIRSLYDSNQRLATTIVKMIGYDISNISKKGTVDFSALRSTILFSMSNNESVAYETIISRSQYYLIKFFGTYIDNFITNDFIHDPVDVANIISHLNEYANNNLNIVDKTGEQKLNESQEKVLGRFESMLGTLNDKSESEVPRILVVHGPANTGKTTLIKSMIQSIKDSGIKGYEVYIGAKSNVTKNVLADELGRQATTVFDILYSGTPETRKKVYYTDNTHTEVINIETYKNVDGKVNNEKLGKAYPHFSILYKNKERDGKILSSKVPEGAMKIFFIDESQNLSQEEINDFKKVHGKNSIIVLLGDPMQPNIGGKNEYFNELVKEDTDTIYILDKINFDPKSDSLDIFLMNFLFRQTNFGKDIGSGGKIPLATGSIYSPSNTDSVQIIPLNTIEVQDNTIAMIMANSKDILDSYILVYKNETRQKMNSLVRSKMFNDTKNSVVDGDKLIYLNSDKNKNDSTFSIRRSFIAEGVTKLVDQEKRNQSVIDLYQKLSNDKAEVYVINGKQTIFIDTENTNLGKYNGEVPIVTYGYSFTSDGALGTRAGTTIVYNDFNEGLGGANKVEKERVYTALTRARLNGKLYIADAPRYLKYGIKSEYKESATISSLDNQFSIQQESIHIPMYVKGSVTDQMVHAMGYFISNTDNETIRANKDIIQSLFQRYIQSYYNLINIEDKDYNNKVEEIHTVFSGFFSQSPNKDVITLLDIGINSMDINSLIKTYNEIFVERNNSNIKSNNYDTIDDSEGQTINESTRYDQENKLLEYVNIITKDDIDFSGKKYTYNNNLVSEIPLKKVEKLNDLISTLTAYQKTDDSSKLEETTFFQKYKAYFGNSKEDGVYAKESIKNNINSIIAHMESFLKSGEDQGVDSYLYKEVVSSFVKELLYSKGGGDSTGFIIQTEEDIKRTGKDNAEYSNIVQKIDALIRDEKKERNKRPSSIDRRIRKKELSLSMEQKKLIKEKVELLNKNKNNSSLSKDEKIKYLRTYHKLLIDQNKLVLEEYKKKLEQDQKQKNEKYDIESQTKEYTAKVAEEDCILTSNQS